ncbi:hypothetical protein [Oenococcus oeni]|uniref:hypothetical protein n=1 Tax=Oenococcus oeni TaxID=1247 RepID=UPI000297F532|nr:hypothetical protein [Oenococcus oeni]EKP90035.1 hypothetical protein AWRIB129_470 [Oenococcus oeni DSM 20252 = AWRIB129]OIL18380.1 hypothetical protein ATW99_09420 [Oenococcus oeni]OIL21788.1 hypothetical protein ATX01_10135 [Oenococcus oeni]OIL40931.1 hypothetical protein ATX13_09385 [Oenococcus oeni]OIL46850.1 hypothetical protein ATX17_09270 [Oenococcus oeni]
MANLKTINKIVTKNLEAALSKGAINSGADPEAVYEYVDGQRSQKIIGYKYFLIVPGYSDLFDVKVEGQKISLKSLSQVELENVSARVYVFNDNIGLSIKAQSIKEVA